MMQVARVNGVVLPMVMDPANRTLYEELAQLSGPAFDREYMTAQINIHRMGNALYASEAQNGQDASVKGFAAEITPVGVEHLTMARASLRASLQ